MTVRGLRKSYRRMTSVAFTHMRCCMATDPPTKIGQKICKIKSASAPWFFYFAKVGYQCNICTAAIWDFLRP